MVRAPPLQYVPGALRRARAGQHIGDADLVVVEVAAARGHDRCDVGEGRGVREALDRQHAIAEGMERAQRGAQLGGGELAQAALRERVAGAARNGHAERVRDVPVRLHVEEDAGGRARRPRVRDAATREQARDRAQPEGLQELAPMDLHRVGSGSTRRSRKLGEVTISTSCVRRSPRLLMKPFVKVATAGSSSLLGAPERVANELGGRARMHGLALRERVREIDGAVERAVDVRAAERELHGALEVDRGLPALEAEQQARALLLGERTAKDPPAGGGEEEARACGRERGHRPVLAPGERPHAPGIPGDGVGVEVRDGLVARNEHVGGSLRLGRILEARHRDVGRERRKDGMRGREQIGERVEELDIAQAPERRRADAWVREHRARGGHVARAACQARGAGDAERQQTREERPTHRL